MASRCCPEVRAGWKSPGQRGLARPVATGTDTWRDAYVPLRPPIELACHTAVGERSGRAGKRILLR